MNRVLNAMAEHGLHGEWVDENILIYVDDQFKGKFIAVENGFEYQPTTMMRMDFNTMNRIVGALGDANEVLQ